MCSRCVRFTREISGTAELQVVGRGTDEEIDVFPGQPCNNKLAGQRGRHLPGRSPVQQGFSLQAAGVVAQECQQRLPRLQHRLQHPRRPERGPRLSLAAAAESAGAGPLHVRRGPLRLEVSARRGAAHGAGAQAARRQPGVARLGRGAGRRAIGIGIGTRPGHCRDPLTLDDARGSLSAGKLREVALSQTQCSRWAPFASSATTTTTRKTSTATPIEPAKFTIRAEKCPNRRGVEIILKHFAGSVTPWGDVLGRAASGDLAAVYCVGGDPRGWISEEQAAALAKPQAVIVQDIFASAATRQATAVLPGGSFAERDGTFVNHARPRPGHPAGGARPRWFASGRAHPVGAHGPARTVQSGSAPTRDGRGDPGARRRWRPARLVHRASAWRSKERRLASMNELDSNPDYDCRRVRRGARHVRLPDSAGAEDFRADAGPDWAEPRRAMGLVAAGG